MSGSGQVRYTREFKLSVLERMASGENVTALTRELGIRRKRVYEWRKAFRESGPEGLRGPGRPPRQRDPSAVAIAARPRPAAMRAALAQAQARVAELERKIGQQQLELDFFKQALRQVGASGRASEAPGATASTPSSRRRRSRKAD